MNLDLDKPNRNSIAVESKNFNSFLQKNILKKESPKSFDKNCPETNVFNIKPRNRFLEIQSENDDLAMEKLKKEASQNVAKNLSQQTKSLNSNNNLNSIKNPNPLNKTIDIQNIDFPTINNPIKREIKSTHDHISIPEQNHEDKLDDSVGSKEPNDKNTETFDNNWDYNIKKVLRAWKNITKTYAYIHDRTALYYYCIHVFIQLPVILFSTLTGASGIVTFAFGSEVGTFHWINIVTTALSFTVALLSACYTFFNPQKTREKHIRSCNDLKSYSKSITIELLKKKNKREDAYIYLENKSKEYDDLIESMPPFPLLTSILYRSKLQRINNVSKYSSNAKSNSNLCFTFLKHSLCCMKTKIDSVSIDSKAISDSVTNSKTGGKQEQQITKTQKRKSISTHISNCKPNKKPDSNDILNILYSNIHQSENNV